MKAIRKIINDEYIKSVSLKNLSFDDKIKKEVVEEIRKEQQEHYDKWRFYKKLNNAIDKAEKRSENEKERNNEQNKKIIKQENNN